MKVCIRDEGDYPWDVGIEKITATLAANGYQVHLVCRKLSKQPPYEFSNNIPIHRLAVFANDSNNQLNNC